MPFHRYKVAIYRPRNSNKLNYNLQLVLSDHAADGKGLACD